LDCQISFASHEAAHGLTETDLERQAMASSYQKLTAEQVRARYHQRFLADDLQPPRIVDALDADGLIHSSKRDAPLKVHIPLWDGRPPFPGADPNVLRMEWRPSSSEQWLPVGNPEEVPGPDGLPDDRFPLEREIPLLIFRDYEGVFEFRYRVKNWNDGSERESPEVPVTIDRTGPVWVDPLKAMIDIVEKPVITDAVLARDNGVFCIIPDFIEANRPEVSVSVVWMTRPPLPTEDITDFIVYTGLLPADREVLVPADVVRGYGSTTQYAVAILFDKAGNRGERSLPATVPVALGSLPTGLHPCTVPLAEDAERLIDRADAAFPTRVHIEEYTGWLHNHGVQIRWGGQILARTSVGSHGGFPLKIAVPWPRMSQEYDFDSATHVQPVAVDYKILVGDYPFDSPGAININTDFAVPKPGKPDPELIDPSLNLVEFESFSGSHTELTMADINQPATASIELFDDPNVGDTLTLYYNGLVVTSADNPYVIDGTEPANAIIDITIPWDDIKDFPVMDDLPMYYTLTHADFRNPQESVRTTINVLVETVTHPDPEFPPGTVINCNSLVEKDGEWGIVIHIPKSAYLKEGTDVKAEWITYDSTNTEIPGTKYLETLTVSEAEEANGIYWLVPYVQCLKPTYPGSFGIGKTKYSIVVRGTDVPSQTVQAYIAVFEADGSGNDHCRIPRP
jgi:hypothetical protein